MKSVALLVMMIAAMRAGVIDAIQENWPFKIDYVLLEKNYVFMDGGGNNANSDPGTRAVLFSKRLFAVPNDLVFGISKHYVGGAVSYMKFSISYSGLTDTGFTLHSTIPASQYKDTLISYITIYDNYGAWVNRRSFGQFAHTVANGYHSYQSQVTISSPVLNTLSVSQQFIAIYTETIDVTSYYQSDLYKTNYSITSMSQVDIRAFIPQTASPVNLGLSVLTIHYPTLNTALSSFQNYHFQPGINVGVVNSVIEFMTSTNLTSTLFFFVGPTSGGLSRGYNHAFTLASTPEPPVGGLTVTFLRTRSPSLNMIQTRFFSSSTTVSDSVFAYIHLQRTKCSSATYPYLMLVQQQCHDAIPNNYYANSDKQLNLCSVCTDILHCLDCMDTMCTLSQYLNPNTISCVACSSIDSNCQTCRNASCTKCLTSSSKALEGNACVDCNSPDYFNSTSSSCLPCTNIDPHCQSCDNSSCFSCLDSVLNSGLCQLCSSTLYYNRISNTCQSCSDYDPDCYQCNPTECISCTTASKSVLSAGSCVPCSPGSYYNSTSMGCEDCGYFNCLLCSNLSYCISCVSAQYKLENNYCVLKTKIKYSFEAFYMMAQKNRIVAYILFNGDMSREIERYVVNFILTESNKPLQPIDIQFTLEYLSDNNTLKAEIVYPEQSLQTPILNVTFNSTVPYESLETQTASQSFPNLHVITTQQQQIHNQVYHHIRQISSYSGIIFTTLSFLGVSSFSIPIIWRLQLKSYYLFLPVNKPHHLISFLNTTFQIYHLNPLPFSLDNFLPSLYLNNSTIAIYESYGVDRFFIRANLHKGIYLATVLVFCLLMRFMLYLLEKMTTRIRVVREYFKQKLRNVATGFVCFYLSVFSFSASAAFTMKQFQSKFVLLNYVSSLFFLLLVLAFVTIHCCSTPYSPFTPSISPSSLIKSHKLTKLFLTLYTYSQILIPILIPLSHYCTFTIITAIAFQIVSIVIATKLCNWIYKTLLIVKCVCVILFNLAMGRFFLIETIPYSESMKEESALGYTCIVLVVLVSVMEVVEMVVRVVDTVWRNVQILCADTKKGKTQRNVSDHNTEITQNDCDVQPIRTKDVHFAPTTSKRSKHPPPSNRADSNVRLKTGSSEGGDLRQSESGIVANNYYIKSETNRMKCSGFSYMDSRLHTSQHGRNKYLQMEQ